MSAKAEKLGNPVIAKSARKALLRLEVLNRLARGQEPAHTEMAFRGILPPDWFEIIKDYPPKRIVRN